LRDYKSKRKSVKKSKRKSRKSRKSKPKRKSRKSKKKRKSAKKSKRKSTKKSKRKSKCSIKCWKGYKRVPGKGCGKGSCVKKSLTKRKSAKKSKKSAKKSNKNDKKYITVKVKVLVKEEDFKDTPNKKIKDKDAKILYPSIVKWYKERLCYLPYIKVDSIEYPYI